MQIVAAISECKKPGKSVSDVARKYGMSRTYLYTRLRMDRRLDTDGTNERMQVSSESKTKRRIELSFSGAKLRIDHGADQEMVKFVINVVQALVDRKSPTGTMI